MEIGPENKKEAQRKFKGLILPLPMLMLIRKKHEWEEPPISEGTMNIIIAHYNATADFQKVYPPTMVVRGKYKQADYDVEFGLRGLTCRRFETAKRLSKKEFWIYQFIGWMKPTDGGIWMGSTNWTPSNEVFETIEGSVGNTLYKLRGIARYAKEMIYNIDFKQIEKIDSDELNDLFTKC